MRPAFPYNNNRPPLSQHLLQGSHNSFSSESTPSEPEPVYATSSSPGSGFSIPLSNNMHHSRSNSPWMSASSTGDQMPPWGI